MSANDKVLDYDKLVEAYNTNLDVTLRGFRPAEEMLDTWVPDDDVIRSLTNLVEAAQLCHSASVSIRVARKTLEPETAESTRQKLSTLGEAVYKEEPEAITFAISKLQETAAFRSVRPVYQQRLRERFARPQSKRPLKLEQNQIQLKATEGQITMSWAVHAENHLITDAVFDGSSTGPMEAAVDKLCEILVGLPVQEARDHAIVRLEFALRAPGQRHPVSGIVLPQNADPLFRVPTALINTLFETYCKSYNYKPVANFFDPGPRPSWIKLTPAERERQVSAAISGSLSELDLKPDDVYIVECKHAYAVTVHFGDRLSIPAKRRLALTLERLVRQKCDPRLELFCEEKKDLSKLRRLTEK